MLSHAEVTLGVVLWAGAGTLVASVLSCVPALHVYNIMGLAILAAQTAGAPAWLSDPHAAIPLATGLVVGFAMVNTIPSVLLAAPDESALFTVLPGQTLLMRGRGMEAVMLTALGGLGGAIALVLIGGPLCPRLLPPVHDVFRRHTAWVLWAVIAFMLLSEWPKEGTRGQGGWRRWFEAWKELGAGLLTFVLAGLLGFVLMYRSPIPAGAAFQNLLPAFAGLFGMPWLILNLAGKARIPPQAYGRAVSVSRRAALRGVCAGCLGGGFAAFFPVITGGIGGMLAGHATAQRDDRIFLVAQGASKFVYYVGGLLLLFVPGLGLTRGGAAWMMRGLVAPDAPGAYALALGSIAVSAGLAFALIAPLGAAVSRAMERRGQRLASAASLVLIVLLIAAAVGAPGLLVLAVATGIGLVPVLFHSRRMNALGVILLPMACNMSGFGPDVAAFLGL